MSLLDKIIDMVLGPCTEDKVIEEKVIRVAHMKPKQKAMAKRYRMKNKAKLKRRSKKFKMKIKNKPKKKGYSYSMTGKLIKTVRRKGVRFKKHH